MFDLKKLRELREISDAAFEPMCERDDIERCAKVLPEALDEIERLQKENERLCQIAAIAGEGFAEAVRGGKT